LILLLLPTFLYSAPPSRVYTYTTGNKINPSEVTQNEDAIFNYLSRGVDKFAGAIETGNILDGTLTNADISGSAAITYGKLSLTGGILNADISSSAAIVDTKLAQITTASKVHTSSITGGLTLPSGAVFFMITGSCPTGSTDVTATYTGKSVRINATQGSTGGSDTVTISEANLPSHIHAAGTLTGGAHTHSLPYNTTGGENPGLTTPSTAGYEGASPSTGSAGAVAVTGSTGAIGSGTATTITNPYVTCKMCQVN